MYNYYKQPIMAFWAFALLAISMLWGASAYAFTPAGTVIKNLATVSYEDSLGNSYTAQSNESAVTVAEVYDAKLEKGHIKDGAIGQTVYFAHQLINMGNSKETFTLTIDDVDDQGVTTRPSLNNLKIYHDINGNGQPDSGEPVFTGQEFTVAAGTTANLVAAAQVPESAADKAQLKLTLTATSTLLPSDGSAVQKNTDTINVVANGPVLSVRKQIISHTAAEPDTAGTVKYRIEVTNNGTDLVTGRIYDFFPAFMDISSLAKVGTDDHRLGELKIDLLDSELKAQLPLGTEFIDFSEQGKHENGLYVDVSDLDSGANLSLDFEVTYKAKKDIEGVQVFTFKAGEELKNKAFVGFNMPGDVEAPAKSGSRLWDRASESNITTTKLAQYFGVEAKNKAGNGNVETLDSAPAGGIAEFVNTITNMGNGSDTFNLTVKNTNFPPGTTFSLWDEKGNVPLNDTNGDGIIDTGLLTSQDADASKNSIKIMVKAHLPRNQGGNEVSAELTAKSVGDASKSGVVTEKLMAIDAESIDLANYLVNQTGDAEIDYHVAEVTIKDFFEGNNTDLHPTITNTSTVTLLPGNTAQFGLFIANKSATSSSYSLESTIFKRTDADDDEAAPAWKVTYLHYGVYKYNEDTKTEEEVIGPTELPITVTPNLPANTVLKVIAKVEIPADVNQAIAGDYKISFRTQSSVNSSMSNSTTNQITVWPMSGENLLDFGPSGANQVEPGGASFYEHKLVNLGNTDLNITFTDGDTVLGDWNYLIYEKVGDDLVLISEVKPLKQGEEQDIIVKVMAPATAAPGFVFNLKLTAEVENDTAASVTLIDSTTVISGQIVLTKSVAKADKNNDVYTGPFNTRLENVKPGEAVVWKVEAVVQGSAEAKNVIITDDAPAYTQFVSSDGSARSAILGNPTITYNGKTVEVAPTNVVTDGKNITFYVGNMTDVKAGDGGIMQPGDRVVVTFEVILDE